MSKHSNREKEVMLWVAKNYPEFARIWRFDTGQAYAKFSLKACLAEYKRTKSITAAMKKLVIISYGVVGWPDLTIIFYGIFIGVEIKVGKDKQREEQKNMENTLKRIGGAYILLTDKDTIENQLRPTMEAVKNIMEPLWLTKK